MLGLERETAEIVHVGSSWRQGRNCGGEMTSNGGMVMCERRTGKKLS